MEKYAPIQENQEEIKIQVVNEISDTESNDSNLIILKREMNPVEILEPTTKGKLYMQASKVKKIDK